MAKAKPSMRFQADLSRKDALILNSLKSELDIRSNAELLSETLGIMSWLVRERRSGHSVGSLDKENRLRELVSSFIERAVVEQPLPRVEIDWTPEELGSLAQLASGEPGEPPNDLIDIMKGR